MREMMRNLLVGQVFDTLPRDELAKIDGAELERRRLSGDLCYPPGREREIRFKRLEQLRNYEHLLWLKAWCKDSGRQRSSAG